jgi:hypothetical protein
MVSTLHLQGRAVSEQDLLWLRHVREAHPHWSRKQLARQLAQHWDWRDGTGRLKDFAARSLLFKLHGLGLLTLPPLRLQYRTRRRPPAPPPHWQPPVPWTASLAALAPVRLLPVRPDADAEIARLWAFYLHAYHYRGLRVVGENLGYLARDTGGRDLAALLFGAPAWRCAPRDRALGWTEPERRAQLHTLANNTRFLILPWVRVPHLASHLLGQAARRISADWQAKYGHGLHWLESFVERDRFAGTCYRAANWRCLGQTQGRSRQDRTHRRAVPVKDIYLYPLGGGAR